jgi:hypothetical protein
MTRLGLQVWLGLAVTLLTSTRDVHAATYVVDRGDDSASFTACDPAVALDCTLRGAILAANANPGLDGILFDFTTPFGKLVLLSIPRDGPDSPEEGDLDVTDDLVIDGEFLEGVFLVTSGGFNDRILDVASGVQVFLLDLFVSGGNVAATECGGGIRIKGDASLQRVEVTNSTAIIGGGICIREGAGTVLLARSSVTGNKATSTVGGGIELAAGGLELVQSTVSGNTAPNFGGGIFIRDTATGPVSFEYVTIADNATLSNLQGAADIYVHADFPYPVHVVGSVIDGDCHDPSYRITSLGDDLVGGNLEGPGDTCHLDPMFDQVGVPDMRLEPLAFGPGLVTRSHQPRWDSPAVDDPLGALTSCPTSDQRFAPRPQDGDGDGVAACDSGSVEALPPIFVDGFESGDASAWSSVVP